MSEGARRCTVHVEDAAQAACTSCGRTMCGACWRHDVDGQPWCEGCVTLVGQPTPVVLYVAASLLVVALIYLASRRLPPAWGWGALGFAAVVVILSAYRLYKRAEAARGAREIVARPEPTATVAIADASRGRLRRLMRAAAPPVSGSIAALVGAMLLLLIAGAVPTLLHLPRWLEWELVVLGWWAVWTAAFAVLLFRGWRIAQDMPDVLNAQVPWPKGSLDGAGAGCDPIPVDSESCLYALAMLVALAAALALSWVLVELVVPVLFVGAYWFAMRALTRVANDPHDCAGSLGRSMFWGGLWALLYTLPIAALIGLGHAILAAVR